MRFIFRCLGYIFCTIAALAGIGAAGLFSVLYFFSSQLPDHNSLKKYSPDLASRVFLQDGSKLCEYANEKRYFIPIDKIPIKLINAFIAVEDKHFFEHAGIDFYGVARSIVKNLENLGSGKRPQGASTITQQVARIFLIKNNEVSYIRKLKEAILSFRIENALTKSQILELYLNQIYMGIGTYGVAAAAKVYFNKTVDELTLAECSYLASLAKGANNYHPIKYKEKALERRNWAISRQLQDGYITRKQYIDAIKEDLVMVSQIPDETANYFSEEVRKYLISKFPYESLNKEGLIVRSTLDAKLQKCAYSALRKGLEEFDRRLGWRGPLAQIDMKQAPVEILDELQKIPLPKGAEEFTKAVVISTRNKSITVITETRKRGKILESDARWAKDIKTGDVVLVTEEERLGKRVFSLHQLPKVQGAIVVVETDTGRILAMQGGYSFEQSEFNRATQAMRQTGSAFKPFVYLAGLENGFTTNSIIDASPVEIDLGEKLGVWKPRNYKGKILENVTFRQAIERSINTATIRVAQEVGIGKIAKIANQFGVFDDMPELLSYALGAGETTLLRLTTAYAMFANGGKYVTPTMVDYIQDKHGRVVFKIDERLVEDNIDFDADLPPKLNDNRKQILSEQSIYQLTTLLEGVMQRGSGASASFLNIPIAGKTGTSNESRDTWFVGYTPDIAIGVFVGFDDHSKSLGQNANGTNTALPIFIDFMTEAKKYLTPKPFRVPKGIKQRKIDSVTGGAPTENSKSTILEAFKEEEEVEPRSLLQEKSGIAKLIEKDDTAENIKPVLGIY